MPPSLPPAPPELDELVEAPDELPLELDELEEPPLEVDELAPLEEPPLDDAVVAESLSGPPSGCTPEPSTAEEPQATAATEAATKPCRNLAVVPFFAGDRCFMF
jgi:hypothetical protein